MANRTQVRREADDHYLGFPADAIQHADQCGVSPQREWPARRGCDQVQRRQGMLPNTVFSEQDRKLSPGEIGALQDAGFDIEALKTNPSDKVLVSLTFTRITQEKSL
jgi:hypothetical protein